MKGRIGLFVKPILCDEQIVARQRSEIIQVFGSAGFKLLSSSDAKKVYTQTTAAVLRMKDSTMETVSKVQEQAGDILEDAKAINEARAAKAEAEVIEDAAKAETAETNE